MKKLSLFFGVAFLMVALMPLSASAQNSTYEESVARTLEPIQDVYIRPLVGEIQIVGDERITHKWHMEFQTENEWKSITISSAKANALYEAIDVNHCDLMVGTTYKLESNAGGITVWVTGYPAKYVNFRNLGESPEDYKWLKEGLFEGQELRKELKLDKTEAMEDKGKKR